MKDENKTFKALKDEFLSGLGAELANRLRMGATQDKTKTVAFFADLYEQKAVTFTDIVQRDLKIRHEAGLLVVKNVNIEWIAALTDVFGVDMAFFQKHAVGPSALQPWDAVFPDDEYEKRMTAANDLNEASMKVAEENNAWTPTSWHVDGVIEYCTQTRESTKKMELRQDNVFPRVLHYDFAYGWNANVRFSYCTAGPTLHILLIDSPPSFLQSQAGQEYSKLWLPLSRNRGGVMLPSLYNPAGAALMDTLTAFASHAWHIRVLAGLSEAKFHLNPALFFYLVISSTWQTNMSTLSHNLEQIAFNDIRRPNIEINDRLHDYRQYLAYLRTQVTMARHWIPDSVSKDLDRLEHIRTSNRYVGYPAVQFEQILLDAKRTDTFLMDSFQLLMSSMNVLEAQRSLTQASRAQKVTTLAFVYAPLSFVTGIFGMNVAEINGAPLSLWVPVVVLAVTAVCTLVVFCWHWLAQRISRLSSAWRSKSA